jgi:hypothetical protein
VAGAFTCLAPTSALAFTVSSSVLQALPPSSTIAGISFSSLPVSNISTLVTLTAAGLDVGWVEASVENTITARFLLDRTHAFADPNEAEARGISLVLPTPDMVADAARL